MHYFSVISENITIFIVHCQKVDSLGYIVVSDSMGLTLNKCTKFSKTTWNNSHYSVQGYSRSPMESPYATFYASTIVTCF